MRRLNERVEAYESTLQWAREASSWRLKVKLNWGRWRLKRTRSEIQRITNFALEHELSQRPIPKELPPQPRTARSHV